MTNCPACDGYGIFPVDYSDDPAQHYALCLCAAGEAWRCATNNGKATNPLWHVWAAQHDVAHEHIVKLEDYATPAELATFGFRERAPAGAIDALAAAARNRRVKR